MYRLIFVLEKNSYVPILEINDWLRDCGIRSVTADTLVSNLLKGSPERYYRMRETDLDYGEFTITFSQENDRVLFKLRWSDFFKSSKND